MKKIRNIAIILIVIMFGGIVVAGCGNTTNASGVTNGITSTPATQAQEVTPTNTVAQGQTEAVSSEEQCTESTPPRSVGWFRSHIEAIHKASDDLKSARAKYVEAMDSCSGSQTECKETPDGKDATKEMNDRQTDIDVLHELYNCEIDKMPAAFIKEYKLPAGY